MRSHLERAIKDEAAASEEPVARILPIILDDMVGLSLDPPIERDQRGTGDPTSDVDSPRETVGNTEACEGEHAVEEGITGGVMGRD